MDTVEEAWTYLRGFLDAVQGDTSSTAKTAVLVLYRRAKEKEKKE